MQRRGLDQTELLLMGKMGRLDKMLILTARAILWQQQLAQMARMGRQRVVVLENLFRLLLLVLRWLEAQQGYRDCQGTVVVVLEAVQQLHLDLIQLGGQMEMGPMLEEEAQIFLVVLLVEEMQLLVEMVEAELAREEQET
jgi:hypothetical protein